MKEKKKMKEKKTTTKKKIQMTNQEVKHNRNPLVLVRSINKD